MRQAVLIGQRPPLSPEYQEKIREIAAKLNEDALEDALKLTGHDALLLCIDRAHRALFPEKHVKRYEKIGF